jgi:hypothetical protein
VVVVAGVAAVGAVACTGIVAGVVACTGVLATGAVAVGAAIAIVGIAIAVIIVIIANVIFFITKTSFLKILRNSKMNWSLKICPAKLVKIDFKKS